jgi:hypothetical protein
MCWLPVTLGSPSSGNRRRTTLRICPVLVNSGTAGEPASKDQRRRRIEAALTQVLDPAVVAARQPPRKYRVARGTAVRSRSTSADGLAPMRRHETRLHDSTSRKKRPRRLRSRT